MSSRGSVAVDGGIPTDQYVEVRDIHGAKVLKGLGHNHSLPDYSHTPNRIYIKMDDDGKFRELRVYGPDCRAYLEIALHPEPKLSQNGRSKEDVLHYHTISGPNFERSDAILLKKGDPIYEKYRYILEEFGL